MHLMLQFTDDVISALNSTTEWTADGILGGRQTEKPVMVHVSVAHTVETLTH